MFRKTLALMLLLGIAVAQDSFEREAADIAEDTFDDAEAAADELVEAGEELIEEGEDALEAAENAVPSEEAAPAEVKAVAKTLEEEIEEEELYVILIGVSYCLDVLWWFLWGWFIYVQTNAQDSTMFVNSDGTIQRVPISWFWGGFSDTVVGWTAIQYLWVWLFYMLLAVPGFIFWIMDMTSDKTGTIDNYLFDMWVTWPGVYGSWILYFFAVLFPILQLSALNGDINQRGWTNAIVQLIMHLISWLYTGLVHVLGYPYINRRYQRMLVKEEAPAAVEAPAEEPEEEVVEEVPEEEPVEEEVEDDDSEEAF